MNYPSRFHIGTQKAGSTYLYNLLSSHPNISLHNLTEVNFFDKNYEKEVNWYLNGFQGEKIRIDTSPKYFMNGQIAAPRLKEYEKKYLETPALFLLILRNPIDYVNSHFEMQKRLGFFENNPKYKNAPTNLLEFIKTYPEYLERAFYYKILKNHWLSYFSIDQFKIVIFEDFIKNQEKNISEILKFWQLPLVNLESSNVSKNQMPKYLFLSKLQNIIIKHQGLKKILKSSKLANSIYDKFLTEPSKNKLTLKERSELKNIFEHDVKSLKELTGIIPEWQDFI